MEYEPGWEWQPDKCPADAHFIEWGRSLYDDTILHVGTGKHHEVAKALGYSNLIMGVTLSPDEVTSYVELVSKGGTLSANYKLLFTDVHTLNPMFLPPFDVITLFHLGEIYTPKSYTYSLEEVVFNLKHRLRENGVIIAYTGSVAWQKAEPVFDRFLIRGEEYKSLQVFK